EVEDKIKKLEVELYANTKTRPDTSLRSPSFNSVAWNSNGKSLLLVLLIKWVIFGKSNLTLRFSFYVLSDESEEVEDKIKKLEVELYANTKTRPDTSLRSPSFNSVAWNSNMKSLLLALLIKWVIFGKSNLTLSFYVLSDESEEVEDKIKKLEVELYANTKTRPGTSLRSPSFNSVAWNSNGKSLLLALLIKWVIFGKSNLTLSFYVLSDESEEVEDKIKKLEVELYANTKTRPGLLPSFNRSFNSVAWNSNGKSLLLALLIKWVIFGKSNLTLSFYVLSDESEEVEDKIKKLEVELYANTKTRPGTSLRSPSFNSVAWNSNGKSLLLALLIKWVIFGKSNLTLSFYVLSDESEEVEEKIKKLEVELYANTKTRPGTSLRSPSFNSVAWNSNGKSLLLALLIKWVIFGKSNLTL
ncbi:hypothetical protein HID58_087651, partial [Brassica napus]